MATKAQYDAMIARVRVAGKTELAEALAEERDERELAAADRAADREAERLDIIRAKNWAWGNWNN